MNRIWKRGISLLLVVCTLVGYIVLPEVPAAKAEVQSQEVTATNVITNGTFEKQLSDGTVQGNVAGWQGVEDIWTIAAEEGNESNYVAKVDDNSSTGGRYIYYRTTVEPGCTYTFSIDYKGTYTSGSPGLYLRRDSHAGSQNNLHYKGSLVGSTWKNYTATVEIPEDVTTVYLVIATGGASVGTACFDNISLTKGVVADDDEGGDTGEDVTPATGNLIPNSTFGDTDPDTDGWRGLANTPGWSVVADPDKAGNFILQLADDSTTAGGYVFVTLDVEVGFYKLKMDYKTDDTPQLLVRGNAYTSAGVELVKEYFPKTSGEWKTYETVIEVTRDIADIHILLNSGGAAKNFACFDNVSYEKMEVEGEDDDNIVAPENGIVISDLNMLDNPFFELTSYIYATPLDASAAPNGWTVEIAGEDVKLFKTDEIAHKGTRWSVHAVDDSVTGSFKLSTKVENITPGTTYGYTYARTGTGAPKMVVRFYGASGNLLLESANGQEGHTNWREASKTVKAPTGTSYAIVSLESTAAQKCDIYLDTVTFYATTDSAKTNLLSNASFEEYPADLQDVLLYAKNEGTLEGWAVQGGQNVSLVKTKTELDKMFVGNYMVHINDATATSGGNITYTLDVEPGKTYTLSGMFRGEYSVGTPGLMLAYFQDEDCTVGAEYAPGKYHKTGVVNGLNPDSWVRASYFLTAPENAHRLQISIRSANASVGWFYVGNLSVMEQVPEKFDNLDFEDLDASGAVESWNSYEGGKLAASTKNPFAGKVSLQIKDNSQAVQQGTISDLTDLIGYWLTGYNVDDLSFSLTARVKDAKNVKAQLTMVYYDNGFNVLQESSVTSAGTGKWQFLVVKSKMPSNAAYGQIVLTVGDSASATGTVYLDDVTLCAEYGQYVDEAYDYDIKYTEGNRLFYTKEGLEAIREFAMDDTVNAFGVSGADAYRSLIKEADALLEREYLDCGWDAGENNDRVTFYRVYLDHIQDISADPLLNRVPGGRLWPYLEGIAGTLRNYFQTMALAYAITGDTKYSDKAISWAMDICQWEYWYETQYCWPSEYNGTLDNPRIIIGMATIYDMCYDQLTKEQRDLIVQNIIYKGLEPMYLDLTGPNRLQFDNKFMVRCGSLVIGTLAIINEDNKAQLGKYIDRAFAFATAFLDNRYSTCNNEGFSYTNAIDELTMGMEAIQRITGREGLLDHPYFSEIMVDWVTDFLSPDAAKQFPVFSDSYGIGQFFKCSMLFQNKIYGNGKAGYFLQQTGLDKDYFKVLLYFNYDPVITEPTENDYVAYIERVGYGGLRTGWEEGELMFYIIGNNSKLGHNQYDQLSFQISTNGLWPAADPGYSNLSDGFDEMQGHNIILVDGQWQTVKGEGTLEQIVDAQLYGQFSGSAPGAYAEGLLTQWDRHAIMINHSDRPYYVVIDEMASETERVFDFNLNTAGWEDVTVDGKTMKDGVNKGNKVAVYGSNGYFFAEFVSKDKFNIEAVTYEDGGPVLQADSGKSKSEQYMTILTKPYGIKLDDSCSFLPLLNTPELVSYKTSSHDATIIKSVTASSTALFFFRGHNSGDWIELPFMVEESGTFELILRTCKSYNYGIYKVYIDGEYVATYDGYDTRVYVNNFSLGSHEVAAGEHILKLELTGVNPKSIGSLISVASITFAAEREMPENPIYTQEVYDTEKVLGAKIFHTENNSDIVLLNRTAGKITAGGVTTNGEQTAIIGLMEDGYMEGFTLVAGTSLTFDGKTLVKASSAATVSADFRGKAKYAVTTEKDQSISLYAPYEIVGATVDGKSVKYSVDGKVAKISVPAGTHTVELKVIGAVEYLWGNESGSGKAIYDENGEMIYKHWKDIDGTEYLYEDGQLKIDAYYDEKTKVLVREELLEDGAWQITTHDLIGNISKIEIEHINGNLTTIQYQTDGSIATTITDSRSNILEMTMDYPDGSKTVAQYLDDKTVTTKYGAAGTVLAITTMYNDGRRVEETYDETGKLLSMITRSKGGNREEVVYDADGSVVTSVYTANKLTSVQTVNADGTSVLEEYLEDGSVRVTKYDASGNVLEVTVNGQLVAEENNNLWLIIVIVAVAVIGAAALVIVLVKIRKRNAGETANAE